MLSYMLPVEEKSATSRNFNLSLNLSHPQEQQQQSSQDVVDETTKLLASERDDGGGDTTGGGFIPGKNLIDVSQREDSFDSDASSKKIKMGKVTNTTKRVSFGSTKGSMVETLVFETPTPLPEQAEREFDFPDASKPSTTTLLPNGNSTLDDSGIELQEELERSRVRVSFFQSSQPQQVSPPDFGGVFFNGDSNNNNYSELNNNLSGVDLLLLYGENGSSLGDGKMAAVVTQQQPSGYDRQLSTESGWDNPFRPGGDLSREADEIVSLIKGGKPITPTGDPVHSITNGGPLAGLEQNGNGTTVVDGATKVEAPQLNTSVHNGATKSPQKGGDSKGAPTTTTTTTALKNGDSAPPQTQVVPGPQSASHVVIEDKKKKKCTCCVIQ